MKEGMSFDVAISIAATDITRFIIEYRKILLAVGRQRGVEIDVSLSEDEISMIEDQYMYRVVSIIEGEYKDYVGIISAIKVINNKEMFFIDEGLPWFSKESLRFGQKWIEEEEED